MKQFFQKTPRWGRVILKPNYFKKYNHGTRTPYSFYRNKQLFHWNMKWSRKLNKIHFLTFTVGVGFGLGSSYFSFKNSVETKKVNTTEKTAEVISLQKSLIESIEASDYEMLQRNLGELKLLDKDVQAEILARLIDVSALNGKYSALQLIAEQFGKNYIESNPLASRLFHHPSGAVIERLTAQFYIGQIKESGAKVYLAHYQDRRLLKTGEREGLQDVSGLDSVEDFSIVLSYLKEKVASVRKLSDQFKHIVVFESMDSKSIKDYFSELKDLCDTQQKPIKSTFLLCGAHFTSGDVLISKVKGRYQIKLLYFDSLGADSGYDPFADPYMKKLQKIFPEADIQVYLSEETVQYARKGCSIFAIKRVIGSIDDDEVLSQYPQYQFEGQENLLFQYAEQHVTDQFASPVKWRQMSNGSYLPDIYEPRSFLPPLKHCIGKQSFSRNGREQEYPMTVSKNGEFEFSQRGVQRTRIGKMGIPQGIAASPDSRQQEQFQAVKRKGTTFNNQLEKHKSYTRSGKPINTFTSYEVDKMRKNVGPWLLTKSPEEIEKLQSSFSLKAWKERNKNDKRNTQSVNVVTKTGMFTKQAHASVENSNNNSQSNDADDNAPAVVNHLA